MKSFKSVLVLTLVSLLAVQSGGAIAQDYQPGKRGVPDKREGAGTRSAACVSGAKKLMPLIPEDAFGASTTKTPALFWYVPPTVATIAEFRLLNKANHDAEIFATQIPLAGTPGIISYVIPAEIAAKMALDQEYRWQFTLICDDRDPSRNPFVEGTVQPIAAPAALTGALAQAPSPRDRAKVYAAAGIWQDAIATLATQRCTNPNNATIQAGWAALLKSVKLDDYAQEPLTDSCRAIAPAQ